jgi:hypothetical protein
VVPRPFHTNAKKEIQEEALAKVFSCGSGMADKVASRAKL